MKENYGHLALLGAGAVGLLVYFLTRNTASVSTPVPTGTVGAVAPVPAASIAPIQLGNVTIGDTSASSNSASGCGCDNAPPGQPVLKQIVQPGLYKSASENFSGFNPSNLTYNKSAVSGASGLQVGDTAPNGRAIEAPPEFIGAI